MRLFGVVDLPARIRARAVLGAARRFADGRILDLGAGSGVYALFLTRRRGREVLALDIDGARVADLGQIAGRLGREGLRTLRGDELALEGLPAAAYSLVLAVEVLQYFADLERTLAAARRLLRPGGALVAHVPIRPALWPHEHRLFTDAELRRLFLAAGFEPPEIRPTFGPAAEALCRMYAWCAARPLLAALAYPALLALARVLSPFSRRGSYRLVVARRPMSEGAA